MNHRGVIEIRQCGRDGGISELGNTMEKFDQFGQIVRRICFAISNRNIWRKRVRTEVFLWSYFWLKR